VIDVVKVLFLWTAEVISLGFGGLQEGQELVPTVCGPLPPEHGQFVGRRPREFDDFDNFLERRRRTTFLLQLLLHGFYGVLQVCSRQVLSIRVDVAIDLLIGLAGDSAELCLDVLAPRLYQPKLKA
jgi:hypothetical protein